VIVLPYCQVFALSPGPKAQGGAASVVVRTDEATAVRFYKQKMVSQGLIFDPVMSAIKAQSSKRFYSSAVSILSVTDERLENAKPPARPPCVS
jgi:hypothetical protein